VCQYKRALNTVKGKTSGQKISRANTTSSDLDLLGIGFFRKLANGT